MERFAIMVIGLGLMVAFLAPNTPRGAAPASVPENDGKVALVSVPTPTPTTQAYGETTLQRDGSGQFHIDGRVNSQPVNFLVDTGADTISLSLDTARSVGLMVDKSQFQDVAMGASGPIRGQRVELTQVEVGGRSIEHASALVLEGLGVNLLGQSALRQFGGVELHGDTMVLR